VISCGVVRSPRNRNEPANFKQRQPDNLLIYRDRNETKNVAQPRPCGFRLLSGYFDKTFEEIGRKERLFFRWRASWGSKVGGGEVKKELWRGNMKVLMKWIRWNCAVWFKVLFGSVASESSDWIVASLRYFQCSKIWRAFRSIATSFRSSSITDFSAADDSSFSRLKLITRNWKFNELNSNHKVSCANFNQHLSAVFEVQQNFDLIS
jgi:hypothetical protein